MLHPEKALFPSEEAFDRSKVPVSLLNSLGSAAHWLNAELPMGNAPSPSAKLIFAREVQPLKAESPMAVGYAPAVTLVRPVHPTNNPPAISVTPAGRDTVVRAVHPLNV